MAEVPIEEQQEVSPGNWRLFWLSAEDGTFYVWRNGTLLTTTSSKWITVQLEPGESVYVEVYDSPTDVPTGKYSRRLVLEWAGHEDAAWYTIEQYIDGEWTTVGSMYRTDYHRYPTNVLPDCAESRFRITPVGTNGANGQPQYFSAFVVGYPDQVVTDVTYAAGAFTADEA